MDCVANIVGYIVFNILTINSSFLDEIQYVFLSKWSAGKALQSLIIWNVFWMLCVFYGWLSMEVPYKKIWFCSFFCYFFRSTEVCFSQCISYSRVFRFEHIYKCSTWSLLFGDMIELNKCCVVEINNSKQKSGARLLTSTIYSPSPTNWHNSGSKRRMTLGDVPSSVLCTFWLY
jgi:hypothetical protein